MKIMLSVWALICAALCSAGLARATEPMTCEARAVKQGGVWSVEVVQVPPDKGARVILIPQASENIQGNRARTPVRVTLDFLPGMTRQPVQVTFRIQHIEIVSCTVQ